MAYLFYLGVNLLDDFVGVRAGYLIDADIDARTAVGFTNDIVVLRPQFHTGYVANAQHITVRQRSDYKVLVLLFLFISSAIFQHILERVLALSTQRTCSHLHVLLVQHLRHIVRSQSVLGHL